MASPLSDEDYSEESIVESLEARECTPKGECK
jgi:hypothetical protein